MIRAKMTVANPDDVEASLSITMTIGEWKKLREQLSTTTCYPASEFSSAIRDLVWRIERVVIPDVPSEATAPQKPEPEDDGSWGHTV